MSKKRDYDIFISHSSEDKPWAAEFATALRDAGAKTWFDVSEPLPGEPWQDKIGEALRESRVLVIILSHNSLSSPWTFFELGAAVAGKKKIVPVATEKLDWNRLPSLLRQFQILEESSPEAAGRQVAETLKHAETKQQV